MSSTTSSTFAPVRRKVAIFGASWCTADSEIYKESVELGIQLATHNYTVLNGGYGGTMEGSAKGVSLAQGNVEGVIVTSLFKARDTTGNPYLTQVTDTASLLDRIQYIIQNCDYFIVMPGTLGTLTELTIAWNIAALADLGQYRPPKIYAYRTPWEKTLLPIAASLNLPKNHMDCIQFIDTAEEVVNLINKDVELREGSTSNISKGSASI